MAVAASPDFFEGRVIPQVPQELLAHPCVRVRLPNGALFRWRFEKAGEELQLDVEGPITLDEASLTRIAVTNGLGIGYFMESDVRDDIAAGRLVRILEDWTPPLVPLCLYFSNRRNSSAAFQAFIALARDFAAGRLA
jgi:DNA-binding transcriptional LysR family regulator